MSRTTTVARLALAAVLVTACSSDDDSSPAATATPATAVPPGTTAAAAPATTAPPTAGPATSPPSTAGPAPTTTDAPATTRATAAPTTSAATTPSPTPGYPPQPAGVPFPAAEWPTGELPPGVDAAVLDAAVTQAFGAADADARVRSIVVVHGGRIVFERYHPLDGPDTVMSSFSVAKSVTATVIGMLVDDGRLVLDEPAPVAEWQGADDPRRAVTLRQLLQMSSGLEWTEEYGAGSVAAAMFTAEDAAALMAAQPLEADPGATFEYSTGTSVLLAGIAADELGGCDALDAYVAERLLDPLGITTATLAEDGSGCWFGGFGADMTTRDFARFGLLHLRGGQWDGRQLVSTAWIDETRLPSPTNPSYGLHWWLSEDGRGFSAEGLFGQRVVVVPDADLVVAVNTTSGGDPFTLVDAVVGAFDAAPG